MSPPRVCLWLRPTQKHDHLSVLQCVWWPPVIRNKYIWSISLDMNTWSLGGFVVKCPSQCLFQPKIGMYNYLSNNIWNFFGFLIQCCSHFLFQRTNQIIPLLKYQNRKFRLLSVRYDERINSKLNHLSKYAIYNSKLEIRAVMYDFLHIVCSWAW